MFFVGVDLAWSPRNTSAVAIARDNLLVKWAPALGSVDEIASYILTAIGDASAFVAIDAPLVVHNPSGSRECDRRIAKLFRRYEAGVYPVNRSLLERYGEVRGERLAKLLENAGFVNNPKLAAPEVGRAFAEVFPHSAMVAIFGLSKTLKYKARPGRSYEQRYHEFRRYQELLSSLGRAKPPLRVPEEILEVEVERLRGRALKRYEDLLDAITCAYVASYCWHHGSCAVIGSVAEGYILTPMP
jgi:predicted RNase H-like nuclease